jgi:hypothetical protein
MNDDEILNLIQRIEESTPKEIAVAKFRNYGEVALYANREGYLRIAVEMLKCALTDPIPADLHYLFNADSDFGIDQLTTTEKQLAFVST